MKEERKKAGLKCNIKNNNINNNTKIMASGPITSWQIEGGKVERVAKFIFLVSKINADGDYSHEIKRLMFLGRKAVKKKNLESILKKKKDITL